MPADRQHKSSCACRRGSRCNWRSKKCGKKKLPLSHLTLELELKLNSRPFLAQKLKNSAPGSLRLGFSSILCQATKSEVRKNQENLWAGTFKQIHGCSALCTFARVLDHMIHMIFDDFWVPHLKDCPNGRNTPVVPITPVERLVVHRRIVN